jgi:hypothetical protein
MNFSSAKYAKKREERLFFVTFAPFMPFRVFADNKV